MRKRRRSQSRMVGSETSETRARVESWNAPAGPSHWNQSAVSSCSKSSCVSNRPATSGRARFQVHRPAEPARQVGVVTCDPAVGQRDRDLTIGAGERGGRVQQVRFPAGGQHQAGGVVDDAEAPVALDPLLGDRDPLESLAPQRLHREPPELDHGQCHALGRYVADGAAC